MAVGDTPVVTGNTLQVWRAGVLVESRTLVPGPFVTLGPLAESKTITELFLFRETKMPGQNVALIDVVIGSTGIITAKFSNGENSEYATWEDLVASVGYIDTAGQFAQDLLLALTVRRSPDGADKTNMIGGAVAVNCSADIPVVVSYPE